MPFAVGETIGPYRITDQLGQGGMATVFKAYHPALDRFVAIKAMHPVFMEDPSFLARFQREAQVVARLDHPNIVPVYDYSEHERRPYLVMRYIPGETLKARLGRGKLSQAEVTLVVQAVADALAYAHSQGVLHRDIKPSNVLLSEGGRIYLADFGLARIAEAGQSTLSSDVMLGTPQYISPEQARGNTDLDPGTDIYSFGVMLFEIVTGQVPFNADTPYSIVHDHIYSPLPQPRELNPAISLEVEQSLQKALAKERGDRYASVSDQGIAFLRAWELNPPAGISGLAAIESKPSAGEGAGQESVVRTPAVSGDSSPSAAALYLPDRSGQGGGLATPTEFAQAESGSGLPIPAGDSQDQLASQVRERLQSGQSKTEKPVKKGRRKRLRWWHLVPVLAAFCICGFIGLAALQGMAEAGGVEGSIQTGTPPAALTGRASDGGSDQTSPTGEGQLRSGTSAENLPPESPVQAARRQVEENPDDPRAYVALALAYASAGDSAASRAALDDGAAKASDASTYFAEAASLLADRGYWLPAAEIFLKAAQTSTVDLPPEVHDRAEMAVYLGSGDKNAAGLLNQLEAEKEAEKTLKDTLQARFQLYQGHPDVARSMVDRILAGSPGFGPALLLQAEIHLSLGEKAEAAGILARLAEGGDPRPWVAVIAGILLTELQS